MNNRWKMNRIGFVNFWFYDRESFSFEDGKMLLRGQNGSGKSITTQSFIPFILDGDRSPSRLDPFGSSDRKMEYYFLGDNKDDSTGYLYLEFRKEETNEYRTIAIGQNAHRGRPMSFWGFVITDNRRVEKDIRFYRESGNTIIPYSRQEMKKVLGDNIPFTTSPKEYKNMVNRYLFGFEREEQYDQFIRLLIKVRAPKLSKEFRPTRVLEILNESLQVLNDEDLKPMADAMDKMDQIQESLEGLKRARTDAIAIQKEYSHYNHYIVATKAHNYLNAKKKAENAEKNYSEEEKKIGEWKKQILSETEHLTSLQAEETALRASLEQYTDPELENLDIRLENLRKSRNDESQKKKRKHEQIADKNEQIHNTEVKKKDLDNKADFAEKKMQDSLSDLDLLQEEIQSDFHSLLRNREFSREEVISKINVLKDTVQRGRKALQDTFAKQNDYETAQKEEEENNRRYEEADRRYDELESMMEHCQDEILTELSSLQNNTFWIPSLETLNQAENIIEDYHSLTDAITFQNVLKNDCDACIQKVNERIAVLRLEEKQAEQLIADTGKKIEEVRNQKEVEPQRDENAEASRLLLKQAGIEAYPFYQAVDFAEGVSEERQAMIEQQLNKAGILDALVVSDVAYDRIQKEFPSLLDTIIHTEQTGNEVYPYLIADSDVPLAVESSVKNILSCFSDQNSTLVLKESGYFRHGMIEGYANKKQSEFIGVAARKRRKEQILAELEDQLQDYRKQKDAVLERKNECLQHMEGINEEFALIPDTSRLNDYLEKLLSVDVERREFAAKKERLEKATLQAYELFKRSEVQMLAVCRTLPYARSVETYEDVLSALDDYREQFNELCLARNEQESSMLQAMIQAEAIQKYLEEVDALSLEEREMDSILDSIAEQIRQTEEILNSPETIERAQKLKEIHQKQDENQKAIIEANRILGIVSHDLDESGEVLLELEKEVRSASADYEKNLKYFDEEMSLNILFERKNLSLAECALRAVAEEEPSYMNRSEVEMITSLMEVFNRNQSDLSNYSPKLEILFPSEKEDNGESRSRYVMNLVYSGMKLNLDTFVDQLKSAIETQEELISAKDRELFEDILSQTISNKLMERIEESRNWVKEMSHLMKNMDTSMGMTFSLDWKPVSTESSSEMDIRSLEKILIRDKELITAEDEERVARHFRSVIRREKENLELNNDVPNYMDLVRNALDYRKWYEFKMSYTRVNEGRKDLTNAAFNRFSGGEKAMAMYVPLFAAVNAQYQKASLTDHPRIIALDEAFAGVDEKNISSMFELVEKLDFDYIMNSQVLWGCYETVKHLKICELLRPLNSDCVTVINYIWNGKEKILNE